MKRQNDAGQAKTGGTGRLRFWLVFMGSAVFCGLLTLNAIEWVMSATDKPVQAAQRAERINGLSPRPGHVLAGQPSRSLR
ncbi:hypothetical protein [Silvimonas iriomotensis]|uniref:Uncharacterized protein n=1 Tax=Silvimonas iriomotensis TaxID=449662 RepID=A0ABQ2PDD5_9NEIS|nr:hypothetical protein [Silvimonas iriomotensis]GGP23417.1 hypothetical protein GCM10010970_34170 [Silvimonas iriomotensis]